MAKKPRSPKPLTTKRRLFVEAYLGEAAGNATEAARIAGYANPGQLGYQLLKHPAIRALVESRVESAAMGADEVLERLSTIARSDMGVFLSFEPDGRYKIDLSKGRQKTAILRKLKETLYGPAIEIHDPVRALKLLGEYHGLFRVREERSDAAAENAQTLRDFLGIGSPPDADDKPGRE